MNENKEENRIFSIIGKAVVAVVVILILLPFALNKWFTVNVVDSPPEGKVYKIEIDNDNPMITRKMVCTFSDNLMHIYTYDQNPFFEFAGVRLDYKYSWSSYHPLVGGLYVTSTPSIWPWKNYELLDEDTRDKAAVRIKLSGINTWNYDDASNMNDSSIQETIITVKDYSIMLDGLELPLISEDDDTDYEIRYFDRECKPFDMT